VRGILGDVVVHITDLDACALSRSRSFACVDLPDEPGREPSPEEYALAVAVHVPVRYALLSLPERQREVLVLRTMLGFSIEEVSLFVGCSAGAVKIAQHRALTALREQLSASRSCSSEEVA
jgi:RNA polymerase sigma-70 factor (ECF subfamily)